MRLISAIHPLYVPEKETGSGEGDVQDDTKKPVDQAEGTDGDGKDTGTGEPNKTAAGEGDQGTKDAKAGEGEETGDVTTPFDDPTVQRELGRKQRIITERTEENELLKRRVAEFEAKGGAGAGEGGDRKAPDGDFDARVNAEAERRANQAMVDREMENTVSKGNKDYGEPQFGKVLGLLKDLGGFDQATMQGILATDDPSKVLFELGSKPENYQRIMDIRDPMRRQAEIVKLSLAPRPKAKVSGAPAPVDPIGSGGGTGNAELRDDQDDAGWYAQRQKQKRNSQGRPWSPPR